MAKILIIDDSVSMLALLEAAISQAGYEAHKAINAREANRQLDSNHYDLVITDIYMPDQDGLETIVNLRKARPELPIIAMSSNVGYMDILKVAKKLGATLCLKKPFSMDALLETVTEAISPAE